jgi:hypothetical protein
VPPIEPPEGPDIDPASEDNDTAEVRDELTDSIIATGEAEDRREIGLRFASPAVRSVALGDKTYCWDGNGLFLEQRSGVCVATNINPTYAVADRRSRPCTGRSDLLCGAAVGSALTALVDAQLAAMPPGRCEGNVRLIGQHLAVDWSPVVPNAAASSEN